MQKYKARPRLKQARTDLALTQKTVTEAIELVTKKKWSMSRYEKIERGVYKVKLNDALAISRLFELPPQELWEES